MNEEYSKGKEMGNVEAQILNLSNLIAEHNKKQDTWNTEMERRASALESWVQTTTGKAIVLTSIFSVIGTAAYILINWLVAHFSK